MTHADPNAFHEMRALLGLLPQASRGAMLQMYRQSLADHLDQVALGLRADGEPGPLLSAVHRIAGAAGMMQDQALCQVARAMELALREDRPDEARALWPRLRERAQATQRLLDELSPPA